MEELFTNCHVSWDTLYILLRNRRYQKAWKGWILVLFQTGLQDNNTSIIYQCSISDYCPQARVVRCQHSSLLHTFLTARIAWWYIILKKLRSYFSSRNILAYPFIRRNRGWNRSVTIIQGVPINLGIEGKVVYLSRVLKIDIDIRYRDNFDLLNKLKFVQILQYIRQFWRYKNGKPHFENLKTRRFRF